MLTVPSAALFGKKTEAAAPAAGAPVAKEITLRTYRNIPYRAQFLSTDNEQDAVTYAIVTQPKKGTVTVADDTFTYTPAEGKTGKDTFTYTATDASGNVSAPATVTVNVDKTKSGVSYQDTQGSRRRPQLSIWPKKAFSPVRAWEASTTLNPTARFPAGSSWP